MVLITVTAWSQPAAECLPFEQVWVRVRSDSRLASRLDWTNFGAQKGQTLGEALAGQNLRARRPEEEPLHLYRLQELDLSQLIEHSDLRQREKLYLTDEDLLAVV